MKRRFLQYLLPKTRARGDCFTLLSNPPKKRFVFKRLLLLASVGAATYYIGGLSNKVKTTSKEILDHDEQFKNLSTMGAEELLYFLAHHNHFPNQIIFLPSCSEILRAEVLSRLRHKHITRTALAVINFEKVDDRQTRKHQNEPSTALAEIIDPDLEALDNEATAEKEAYDSLQNFKNYDIIATNSLGDVKLFKFKDEQDYKKIYNFYDPPEIITLNEKDYIYDKLKSLRERDQIFLTFIPEKEVYESYIPSMSEFDKFNQNKIKNVTALGDMFNKIRYDFIPNSAYFFVIKDEEVASRFNIGKNDVGEIYGLKNTSIFNNRDSNFKFDGREYIINKIESDPNKDEKIELSFGEFLKKVQLFALDFVNVVNDESSMMNFLNTCKALNIKSFLIHHPQDLEDYELSRRIKKFTRLKKELKHSDFQILFIQNANLLKKYFKVIPEKYSDTVRYIDYGSSIPALLNCDYSYEAWKNGNVVKAENTNRNSEEERLIPDTFTLKSQDLRFSKFKFDGKITKNKLKGFVTSCEHKKKEQYYESDSSPVLYFSVPCNGENFYNNVVTSEQNIVVNMFKPGCPSCHAMARGYEKFAFVIREIQAFLDKVDRGEAEYRKHEDNIINKYNILNINKFRGLKVARYNIYNECAEFPSPSSAPLIYFFKKNPSLQFFMIDLLKERVSVQDPEKVTRQLIKIIDDRS